MIDSKSYDFGPNNRFSGRDINSVPSRREPSTGGRPDITKRGYLLKPTGSGDGYVIGRDGTRVQVDEYKPLR